MPRKDRRRKQRQKELHEAAKGSGSLTSWIKKEYSLRSTQPCPPASSAAARGATLQQLHCTPSSGASEDVLSCFSIITLQLLRPATPEPSQIQDQSTLIKV
ncbi:uncharacterized protein [Nothobranchius furzeri]|uniref:uncharacterized protein n=1 Tax=Nothobranchius furzeri TaxID=105023 RepID=UPI00390495FC